MVPGQTYPQYYPDYYQVPQPIQPRPVQPIQNQILAWVQSEEEATKYPLSCGQSIFLMNSNENYLYMKAVDQLGKTTFIKKKLVDESEPQDTKIDLSGYIKKEELESMIVGIIQQEIEKKVSELSFKATKTTRKKPTTN